MISMHQEMYNSKEINHCVNVFGLFMQNIYTVSHRYLGISVYEISVYLQGKAEEKDGQCPAVHPNFKIRAISWSKSVLNFENYQK